MRKFAGPVGKTARKLASPLKTQVRDERVASGAGVYVGPNGTAQSGILARYKAQNGAILDAMMGRAKAETGSNLEVTPSIVH